MTCLLKDSRFALRQLRRSSGFAAVAILTVFGIGATTAIFSIVEGVLLRPLPFPEPDRLVALGDVPEGVDLGGGTPGVTAPATIIYARDTRVFSGLGAYQPTSFELSGAGEPAQINASRLSASTFPVLGISPMIGRTGGRSGTGTTPLQHRAYFFVCGGGCAPGLSRHLQRHCIFRGPAHT